MSSNNYQVRAYNVKHSYDASKFWKISVHCIKPSMKGVTDKHSKREKDRSEDLRKDGMLTQSKAHSRRAAKANWKGIVSFMKRKSKVIILNHIIQ